MADSSSAQDRNLPASARKLEKAREEGNVPRSRDLGHFGAIGAALLLAMALAPTAAGWSKDLLRAGLRFDARSLQQPDAMAQRAAEFGFAFLHAVLPIGVTMAIVGLACGLALGGWNFTTQAIAPKFGKLNPLTGLPKLFSSDRLIDTLRACVLALVLGSVGGFYLATHLDGFAAALALPLPAALSQAGGDVMQGLALLLLALALFALVDVPLQKFQHAKRLRMSHQEAKDEFKEAEGNQEVKSKAKVRMREMANRRMLAAVPKADLVVMNPTHYAVALKYDETLGGAPRVVAKGLDLVAMRIRDTAKAAEVPVLQAPVLARALYAHAELDREIPLALYTAVAQVLAYVYQLRAAMKGQAPMPQALPELPVPAELDPQHRSA
ncbi:MAG TPA: flagellar type III secretion system protein FlhB [Methylibium sp.]|uniref:EscU/YscU/HrcU family type III secretion system export apparatus switch protein n=1 Tax=Methylibium sp. TaxID=2067992 RepID=UPI002DBF920E|nr:flagellar type III secretion system protein FlhB [Methylibium sp.]HEU4458218.1 flagellar type III secretion system protein FlhB [Methylibium sp.]